MKINRTTFIISVFLFIFTTGCSTLQVHQFTVHAKRPDAYQNFYENLDKVIREARVHDASHFSLRGFPYLRANRFLVGLKENLHTPQQIQLLAEWMRQSDLEERKKEILNLPAWAVNDLNSRLLASPPFDKETLLVQLSFYSEKLFEHDKSQKDFYKTLKSTLRDPDEYSLLMRAVGLYPIFSLPVLFTTNASYNQIREEFKTPFEKIEVKGKITTFTPASGGDFSFEDISRIFDPSKQNAFGLPQLTETEINRLVLAFAPVFSQDISADYDKFGEVKWKNNRITIDPRNPTVYYYLSYTSIKDEALLQLNYVMWYSGRFGPYAPWMERGALDGLTMRVTLDSKGSPVMVDVMNNCGCYHFFVPRKDRIERIVSHPFALDPLVATWLADSFPQNRLHLRVISGWHQVRHIDAALPASEATIYQLLPYETLERLPHEDGHSESIFNSHGIMKDSSRMEPLIFFPMGIPWVGYMRQRENHPIKLVGHAHFTDPDLFDRNFVFK